MSRRAWILTVCSTIVAALLAMAAFAPLPLTIAEPGLTANVLGNAKGQRVITISGVATRPTSGQLRMVTIAATEPYAPIHVADAIQAWLRTDEAVMPRDAVYPAGESTQQIQRQNTAEMRQSQNAATSAALRQLRLSPSRVKVTLRLADVGGPSAGLMFTLGIIDSVAGNGTGGDLTGGRDIAGTGTIAPDGTVGPVGGVALKEQAARRDGATVFLVPRGECADASAATPAGLRLVPVTSMNGALAALRALNGGGGAVPHC